VGAPTAPAWICRFLYKFNLAAAWAVQFWSSRNLAQNKPEIKGNVTPPALPSQIALKPPDDTMKKGRLGEEEMDSN
jgi:hypothetical protein